MTQLIFYASKDGELEPAATDKEYLSVQTKGRSGVSGSAPADQFRGVTKMVVYGNVAAIRQFSTQCEKNLNEVPA